MTEYLVMYKGKWFIAHPGAVHVGRLRCEACEGKGDGCEKCDDGYRDHDVTRLCWVDRDGSIICLADEEDNVKGLPDAE